MDNKERLEKLKQLQITKENELTLRSHKNLLSWIDNVAPLLKYDIQHYNNFIQSARTASAHLSSRTITHYLNIAKSIVNQAIVELENKIESPTPNPMPNPTTNESETKHNWHNKPLGKIAIGVIIIIIAAIVIWIIKHYFFINL